MIEVLAANKQAIEHELRERIQAFFTSHNQATESVSITMKLLQSKQQDEMPTIKILVKDRDSGETLHEQQVIT